MRNTPSNSRTRAGFTLVEVLVVTGVIVLLVGLTIAVIPQVTAATKQRSTVTTLALLETAVEEWQLASDRELLFGGSDGIDLSTPEEVVGRILDVIGRHEPTRDILRQIDPEFLKYDPDEEPSYEVLDAWGTPIWLIYPGDDCEESSGLTCDDDNSFRTSDENMYGIAINRRIVFFSHGPDLEPGDLQLGQPNIGMLSTDPLEAAGDNVYSYEVVRQR